MSTLDQERIAFVRLQLRAMKSELQDLESRLILLQQALTPLLPDPSNEDLDPDKPDPATLLHSSLGCWLRDRLSPLLTEMERVVGNGEALGLPRGKG
jgi:hypothetical protein